jgi:iron(III) transport system substrate-binding protein
MIPRITRVLLAATLVASAARAAEKPATAADVVAAAEKEGKLVVYSTTDSALVQPMLKDFGSLYPKIPLEYNDMNSTELNTRYLSEVAAGAGSGDLLWSSAMDLQMKLANDGNAAEYASPEASKLPKWAVWKNEAFATTFEPIAFVYNKRLLKQDVPQSHADLTKALLASPDRFRGKVTAFDPERSGIGFLLVTEDARHDPDFDQALKAYGQVGVKLYTSNGAMLERISSGEHILGFDMFGSYALAKSKKDPSIGIVYPKDYTLVMSRIALVAKTAPHPNAARVFLDYLLSQRGQELIAKASLFALRPGVQGDATADALTKAVGAALKPIEVGPGLLEYLDQKKRLDFLQKWQRALGTK